MAETVSTSPAFLFIQARKAHNTGCVRLAISTHTGAATQNDSPSVICRTQ